MMRLIMGLPQLHARPGKVARLHIASDANTAPMSPLQAQLTAKLLRAGCCNITARQTQFDQQNAAYWR